MQPLIDFAIFVIGLIMLAGLVCGAIKGLIHFFRSRNNKPSLDDHYPGY